MPGSEMKNLGGYGVLDKICHCRYHRRNYQEYHSKDCHASFVQHQLYLLLLLVPPTVGNCFASVGG